MIDYDPHRWRSHLLDIDGSMVREILWRVLACVAWSVVVVAIDAWVWPVRGTTAIHTLVGVALGLLLVFRTNASYDRFWEGRKLWGSLINESRNVARTTTAYLRPKAPDLADEILLWSIVFARAVRNELRPPEPLGKAFDLLPADQAAQVAQSPSIPLAVATKISECLAEALRRQAISDIILNVIDQSVQQGIDYLGGCQRIRRTPLPYVYVVHLRRCLIAYCFTLPIGLVSSFGWWTIPVTLILAYMFFGIEEIGVEIENPFGDDLNDLPLNRFCETIENELWDLLPQESPVRIRSSTKF